MPPTVMEDYLQMMLQMIEFAPDIFFPSPAFPIAFRVAMGGLSLVYSDITYAAIDLLRSILAHECLAPSSTPPPPKFPIYANAIRPVVEQEGPVLTGYLISGLVGDFPEESIHMVCTIFRVLATLWPSLLLAWLPPAVQPLLSSTAPDAAKAAFIAEMNK